MPFKSKAQERFMFSQHPEIAERWTKEYNQNLKKLPEKVKKKKKVIKEGFHMRPAFAAIINVLHESDWIMDRVSGTLSAPAQAIDIGKKKALKPDHRKRMKKAAAKQHAKSAPVVTAGAKAAGPPR